MKLANTILALKKAIYEKKKQIEIHDHPLGWNDETRVREFRELNIFYESYYALLEADDCIKDLKLEKSK